LKFLLLAFVFTSLSAISQDAVLSAPNAKKDPSGKVQIKSVLIRGPYLQVATGNSMVVRWRTDAYARSRVRYGSQPNRLDMAADDSALRTEHMVKIDGLKPGTRYYYSIGSMQDTLQGDESNYFSTLPVVGTEVLYRIGVFGDCGNNSINQRNVRNAFLKYLDSSYLNAWILLGDNTYPDGEDAEYQIKFFNMYKDQLLKKYPLFPSPGNHDYHYVEFTASYAQQSHEVAYYHNFSMPANGEAGGVPSHSQSYYSYDIGNVHFLSLDSYGKADEGTRMSDTLGAQAQWVKKDLEANKNKEWVVAYWHHPPYTMGSHNSDRTEELTKIRENFITILERYGVDLVLCGHSHDYERSKLMSGHLGKESSFSPDKHQLSASSGMYDSSANSCPYIKGAGNKGTVYLVSGSAGQLGGMQDSFPHNAMFYSNAKEGGAGMLEVQENRLDFKWICADGVIRDHFTMMKNVNQHRITKLKKGESATLKASFIGSYKWSNRSDVGRTITVRPPVGKTIYEVSDPQTCLKDVFEVIVTK
jgi:acid phosphatase type 7